MNARYGEIDRVQTVRSHGLVPKLGVQNNSKRKVHIGDLRERHNYESVPSRAQNSDSRSDTPAGM